MVSLVLKIFIEHGSYNKRNVPAKQNFLDICPKWLKIFRTLCLKIRTMSEECPKKNKHSLRGPPNLVRTNVSQTSS